MREKYPDLYPDYGKKFISRLWDESDDEILGYKGCSGEISGFISRLLEGGM